MMSSTLAILLVGFCLTYERRYSDTSEEKMPPVNPFYLCKQPSYSRVCIVVSMLVLCIISFPLQLSKTVEDLEDPYLQSQIPSFHYQRYPNI